MKVLKRKIILETWKRNILISKAVPFKHTLIKSEMAVLVVPVPWQKERKKKKKRMRQL